MQSSVAGMLLLALNNGMMGNSMMFAKLDVRTGMQGAIKASEIFDSERWHGG